MGCVLGKEVSSGVVYDGKVERSVGGDGDGRRDTSGLSVESTGDLEVEGKNGDGNGGMNGSDESKRAERDEGRGRGERRRTKGNARLSNMSKHRHGEQAAAGWPPWLSDVLGEALDGLLPRRADSFEKIDKVGQLYYIFDPLLIWVVIFDVLWSCCFYVFRLGKELIAMCTKQGII